MLTASIVTSLTGAIVFTVILSLVTPRTERFSMIVCALGTLPMCWVMLHFVREPLDAWLITQLGGGAALQCCQMLYAPVTEEPAKVWPLIFILIRRSVTRENLARFAMALGGGFAFGEVFTVAALISTHHPQVAQLPLLHLSPFVFERLQTFVIHSGMTAIVLVAWKNGLGFAPGLLLAMVAHFLVNFPIFMAGHGWLGSNASISATLLSLWVSLGCLIPALCFLMRLDIGQIGLGRLIFGRAICPTCHQLYERRMWGLNFGLARYEPCPNCRKWHWTKRRFLQEGQTDRVMLD